MQFNGTLLFTFRLVHICVKFVNKSSEIFTAIMFVMFTIYKIFHTQFLDAFMIYRHTQFHTPGCNGSLIITLELKAEYCKHGLLCSLECYTSSRHVECANVAL